MKKILLYIFLIIIAFISLYPFIWTFINATHHTSAVYQYPPFWKFGGMFMENFNNLDESVHIKRVFMNSMIVAIVQTILTISIASMAGYAFAKFDFKGKKIVFSLLLFSMMIPYQATIVSLFRIFASLDFKILGVSFGLDSYPALILPGLCNIFAIFLMTQNMKSFPYEIIEAARADGCNEFRIFSSIVVPNMRPAIAATSIFVFMSSWNNFMWPLVITASPEMRTLPVALSSLIGFSIIDYGQVMVGITISTIPIIIFFLLMQRQFIAAVTGSGVKG
ncbi:MAG: carbohydrate ABC transporter permease [Alphaproteobacteria bacterium]